MRNLLSLPGTGSKYSNTKPAGFLSGLWHGLLMPIVFIISLFNTEVSIYEANNNSKWYHLGMVVGIFIISGNNYNFYAGTTYL